MDECLTNPAPFLEAAYGCGIVAADHLERIAGLDGQTLAEATKEFAVGLDDGQLVGAVAWYIRRDHWLDDSLALSIESGALSRLMKELAKRG